jgi:SAUR family protein
MIEVNHLNINYISNQLFIKAFFLLIFLSNNFIPDYQFILLVINYKEVVCLVVIKSKIFLLFFCYLIASLMDMSKGKGKTEGNLIIKTWERCKSIGRGSKRTSRLVRSLTPKSKSYPHIKVSLEDDHDRKHSRQRRVAPEGCFSVYVGPQKQRFVIKTEYANHPLFKMLLEEAESEYGYSSEGPLTLPCNVDIFYRVLMAVEDTNIDDKIHLGCGFAKNYGSYHLLSPSS